MTSRYESTFNSLIFSMLCPWYPL